MRDEFIRVQVAPAVWLSACPRCRQVLVLGDTLESLYEAEGTHLCDEAKQAAEADFA